ncbi:arylalkylamine N-acetyltransferase-like protein [Thermochaetoides thermophila DSM 1495]|uniref:Arylalkylamine N-acetyltransferase-like protein n=1 Tax=Chaetomium thermophilum (strain DSM 1495 / CBS 144.50 / IMI 039719) TaxID=759272 RepID=G0S8E9_CHATD|nr:arylalkylamine N-acetyltransferase-like protein [Thermochaetoides thermophila DSM 1495]EGS21123.1 arylalkylamine N-acetyltransferase-like protein [Thermochaetoides thermophila DSM 1495]
MVVSDSPAAATASEAGDSARASNSSINLSAAPTFPHETPHCPGHDVTTAPDSETNNVNTAVVPDLTATTDPDSDAVDETSDVDGDFATLQKMLSQKRRAAKDSPEARLQKALPFVPTFAPNIRPLTIADVDACVALENAAFPNPEHRATRDKFEYRLTVCPELSLGVFITIVPSQAHSFFGDATTAAEKLETLPYARPVETDRADGAVSLLLAHIVSTRCRGAIITDADMAVPDGWRSLNGKSTEVGHQETAGTVGLHSLAVLPRLQRCGIGQLIMKAFLDQMRNMGLVERVALICQENLISYYERTGFKHAGESRVRYGGGGWHDMVYDLPRQPAKPGLAL